MIGRWCSAFVLVWLGHLPLGSTQDEQPTAPGDAALHPAPSALDGASSPTVGASRRPSRETGAIDPSEGFGVASLPFELGILDPDRGHHHRSYAGGLGLRILGRRTSFPVMFGLGGGVMFWASSSRSGPRVTSFDGGNLSFSSTSVQRTIELRHAELIARVQPWWGLARPFVELELGLAAVWHASYWSDDATGKTIARSEQQRSVNVLFGAGLGVDWRLLQGAPRRMGIVDLVLTTSLKRWYTGNMERPEYVASTDSQVAIRVARAPLAIWVPCLALTLSFDSRIESRQAAPVVSATTRGP
jgi:hypothetical protein